MATRLRHAPGLRAAAPLWGTVRPAYDKLVGLAGRGGLVRTINGTDAIRVHPEQRGVTEVYEPDVWPLVMGALRPGDTFVDVGAFVGLYAIAATRHVGPGGRVVAFEPDPANRRALELNAGLNRLGAQVDIVAAAVGEREGHIRLDGAASSEARTTYADEGILCTTVDLAFPDSQVDVLKIDVEGFEEEVLRGARGLLRDAARRPRAVFVEVHPFAWGRTGTTSGSLLGELQASGYAVRRLDGAPPVMLDQWEEVVAVPVGEAL